MKKLRIRKMTAVVIAASLMMLLFAGCSTGGGETGGETAALQDTAAPAGDSGGDAPAETESGKKVIRIAHAAPGLDESQRELYQCMSLAVDEFNAANPDYQVEYDHYNANFDIQTAITQVETVMTKDYDAMIVFATDVAGLMPSIEAAYQSGIAVVDICDLDRLDTVNVRFLATESVFEDKRDEFLLDYAEKNPDMLPLRTCIMYGLMTQTPQLPRGDRMYDLAGAHPDKFEILDSQTGEWDATKALNITEDWITRFGVENIDYICSANDGMAIGIIQALAAAGRAGEVLVTGIDLTDEGLAMVQEGSLGCTVGPDWYDYAKALLDVTIKAAEDPETYNNVDHPFAGIQCITAENVDEYLEYKAEWQEKTAAYSINE